MGSGGFIDSVDVIVNVEAGKAAGRGGFISIGGGVEKPPEETICLNSLFAVARDANRGDFEAMFGFELVRPDALVPAAAAVFVLLVAVDDVFDVFVCP